MLGVAGGTSKKDAVMAQGFPAPLAANSTSIKLITEAVQEVDKGYFHFGYMYQASAEGGEALGGSTASDGTENLYFAGGHRLAEGGRAAGHEICGVDVQRAGGVCRGQQCGGCGNELCDARTGCNGNSGLSGGRGNAAAHAVPHARGPCPGARGGCRAEAKPQNRRVKQNTGRRAAPVFKPGPRFLYIENHSLGEWFKRRLMSIMGKEKLPLLYWKCGLRTAQASKGRSFKNERRK